MIRKLLLLLVVITILQNTSHSQGAEIKGNCFYDNTTNRVIVRLALRNPTGSPAPIQLAGMRFGIQYNPLAVSYAGFTSYMNNGASPGLNDPSNLSFIGPDTNAPNGFSWESTDPTRNATITSTGGNKVMNRIYINRSTDECINANIIGASQMKVLIDIYFTLVNSNPSYYHLNEPGDYGWGDPEFIAQFLTKDNGGHYGNLTDPFKEIAIVIIRQGNTGNPYQPFDYANASCSTSGNPNPVVVSGSNVNFISPINGVLAGKAVDASVQDKDSHVLVQWKSEYNQLVDYFEVQRKEGNGEFKTIGLVMGKEGIENIEYEFKDKITARDVEPSYRIKVINNDKIITYSDVKKIRLGSEQNISVKVFPNPSSENIRINLPAIENGSLFVCRMYSTEGRIVKVTNVSAANPSVDIKSLTVGSYFMELYNPKSGKRFYTQFSKQ